MNRYDLVLLGLILEKQRSGYDIITEVRNRELDRWANLSTSTVYNRLSTLEKHGDIEGRAERDGNRPERVVFTILAYSQPYYAPHASASPHRGHLPPPYQHQAATANRGCETSTSCRLHRGLSVRRPHPGRQKTTHR